MPGKKVQCIDCSVVMRSDNFKRHIKTCKSRHRLPSDQTSYYQEKNDVIRTNGVNGDSSITDSDDNSSVDIGNEVKVKDDSSIVDSDDNSSMDIGNQTNRREMIQPHRNRQTSPSLQASYQFDSLPETDEDNDGIDPKFRISSYALSEPITRRHCVWFPQNVRAIIVGKSGSGKTTLLNYLLLAPEKMKDSNLIV